MRTLFALLLLVGLAQAAPIEDTAPPFYVGDVAIHGEKVVDLPEDGHGWFTTVFVESQQSPRDGQILSWFNAGELQKLKRQTHFNVYARGCQLWPRYGNLTALLPCVTVQDRAGRVVFKASGNSCHLDSSDALLRAVAVSIRGYKQHPDTLSNCPICPRPEPNPPYNPLPLPGPMPVIPDVGPQPPKPIEPPDDHRPLRPKPNAKKQEETDAWLALAVMGLVAVGGYCAFQWKEKA